MPTSSETLPTLSELGGCIFSKPTNYHGYGAVYFKGKQRKAHRVAWEKIYGPIPEGMHLDHICHNVAVAHGMCLGNAGCVHRSCINVEHLRIVTPSENQLAGLRGLRNRNFCTNGHDLTIEGAIITRDRYGKVGQLCRECKVVNTRNANARYQARKKEALIA